jgi:MFS transporter
MSMQMAGTTRLLLAASFLGTAAESMLVPIYAPLTHRAGGSLVDTGIGLALFSITTGVFVTTVGMTEWFRANIRKLLVAGFLLAAAADLGYMLVDTRLELFLVQMVVGLALGILNPAWDSIYSLSSDDPTRKWAVWTGGINLITGLAALGGTYVVSHYSFRTVFAAMCVLDILAAYCSLVAIRQPSLAEVDACFVPGDAQPF